MALIDSGFAERFAHEWIEAWNSHDLDRILAHYSEDFEFSSPKIVELMGEPSGRLAGKAAIRPYWSKALARVPDLKFELITVLTGIDGVVLYYKSVQGRLAAEAFEFDDRGMVRKSAAHYGG
jgi:ketosteroid isomerase-like protein